MTGFVFGLIFGLVRFFFSALPSTTPQLPTGPVQVAHKPTTVERSNMSPTMPGPNPVETLPWPGQLVLGQIWWKGGHAARFVMVWLPRQLG